MGVLENDRFIEDDKLQGNGVNYHIVSIFLEELKEVGFLVRNEVVDVIFGPFFWVLKKSKNKILVGKVTSCVFDELLEMGRELLGKKKIGVDRERWGCVVRGGCLDDGVFGEECGFGLHEEFLKLEKDLESYESEIVVPEYNEASDGSGDDEEVPQLIAIDNNTNNGECTSAAEEEAEDMHDDKNESNDESLKKSKRARKRVILKFNGENRWKMLRGTYDAYFFKRWRCLVLFF
ncbi:hypothetical protein Fot_26581 [Forsythia ovata]|uniref:Uncharacterized protein n=1 Tax=Forsythia ovata TaxID=205694 RepID=A0ABD1UCA6_9LAMI